MARQRCIRHQGKALAREVVDDGEHAEAAPVREWFETTVARQIGQTIGPEYPTS